MKSKYRKAVTYDLETGGFNQGYNSITEAAFVEVDFETLKITGQHTVVFLPYIDISWIGEPIKDAKLIYKNIGSKDPDTGIKTLQFKDNKVTLKNLDAFIGAITEFYGFLKENYEGVKILEFEDIEDIESTEFADIFKVFYDNAYNPQALQVTGISRELLEKEGLPYTEAFQIIKGLIDSNCDGTIKPVIIGHNIGSLPRRIVRGKEKAPDGFDNPFMEKLFFDNGGDFFDSINDDIIDTLKWSRLKWFELPSYALGAVAAEVNLTLNDAHRALPDTIANAKFAIKMFQHLRGEGSSKSSYERRKFDLKF